MSSAPHSHVPAGGYQVCLYIGDAVPSLEGVKVVDLTPSELSHDAVIEALRASGLTPADLRARVVVQADGDANQAVAVYSALLGFAGRRLDLTDGTPPVVEAAAIEQGIARLKDAGRPDPVPAQIQVGEVERDDLVVVRPSAGLTPGAVSTIRYAKRVRFVPVGGGGAIGAISQLLALAGIRARGTTDRLPYLVQGDEPASSEDDPTEVVGLCLDTLRRGGVDLRRSLRFEDRGALAEKVDPTPRQRLLLAANAVGIEEVLARLGATKDESSDLWHCPRPDRHTHGDTNASMKVVKGKTQCFRCDSERVDALRLVMDTKGLVPDEAAEWLLAGVSA